jgi:HPr kinase/phosphorylase
MKVVRSTTKNITIHGVFLDICGMGVLLLGKSGIGKSELALELINKGHALIADDAVDFTLTKNNSINGCCPKLLKDFLEIRGPGILNIRKLFGAKAVKASKKLDLIIEVLNHKNNLEADRLSCKNQKQNILGAEINTIFVRLIPGISLATLIEVTVRNFQLSQNGYCATEEFIKRQRAIMEGTTA